VGISGGGERGTSIEVCLLVGGRIGRAAGIWRTTMSNVGKRSEGVAEELGGKVKKAVGGLIGNEQMEAEGRAKELAGEAKQAEAKAAERVKGKVEEVTGAIKNRVGHVIDNEQMQAEGRARELAGEARQKANK
jgi:uncharacterized protein YjbJ (UPF0337 family)